MHYEMEKQKSCFSFIFVLTLFCFCTTNLWKDGIIDCTDYIRGGIQYHCHANYYNKEPYYDWMFVLHVDRKTHPCKLIACIPGSFNIPDGYYLIVQQADKNHNTGLVLSQDYLYSSGLIKIDANTINGSYSVVETDSNVHVVTLVDDFRKMAKIFYFTL